MHTPSPLTCLTHAQLPGRQHTTVDVRFSAQRLLPSSATLLLVARGGTATGGTTLAFTLQATVTRANPQVSILFTLTCTTNRKVSLNCSLHYGHCLIYVLQSCTQTFTLAMSSVTCGNMILSVTCTNANFMTAYMVHNPSVLYPRPSCCLQRYCKL